MRRLISAAVAAVVVALASAMPVAGAASTGRIEGSVVNETTGRPQPGVRVVLSAQGPGVSDVQRKTVTGRDGRYVFDGLPTGDDRIYVLDSTYAGGLFPGRPLTLPADTEKRPVVESKIRVWETTSDPGAVAIRRNDMFVVPREGRAAVVESVTITNVSDRAYIGRAAAMDGDGEAPSATFGFALPPSARTEGVAILDATIDVPQIVRTDFGFGTTIAIPPGETRITYSYDLEGLAGSYDLSRTALYEIAEFSIFVADPMRIDGSRLTPAGEVELDGQTYRRWTAGDTIEPGDPIQAAAVAEGDFDPALVAGIGIFFVLLAGAVTWAARRRRRSTPAARAIVPAPDLRSRRDLLVAIAELDLQHRTGDIARDEWAARRAELKNRLRSITTVEPAP